MGLWMDENCLQEMGMHKNSKAFIFLKDSEPEFCSFVFDIILCLLRKHGPRANTFHFFRFNYRKRNTIIVQIMKAGARKKITPCHIHLGW